MARHAALLAALAALVLAAPGCGGGGSKAASGGDPVAQVPRSTRDKVRAARDPQAADFPAAGGKTLQALADSISGGPSMGLAGSVYIAGRENRVAFGVIDKSAGFLYGKTALYVARTPSSPAKGPYVAPADVLITDAPYRSQQAATEADPFAAIYAAEVPLPKAGPYSLLAVTLVNGKPVAAPQQIRVITSAQDKIPEVGERMPKIQTDTVASAHGNVEAIDTRRPTSDMHKDSAADVIGKRPLALLIATPQLCSSRVCGPAVDEALQLRTTYGGKIDFIHQEVYVENDVNKGLRKPLQQLGLQSEPWLFVVGQDGRISARLEGSIGLDAFEQALKTAL